jgi:hypothetical protein
VERLNVTEVKVIGVLVAPLLMEAVLRVGVRLEAERYKAFWWRLFEE